MATTITATDVKALRDRTGAGMMDCKAALMEANGDLDEAITILRKKGMAQVAKKAGRAMKEGLVGVRLSEDATDAVIAEVNCETDFVARTPDFQALVDTVTTDLLAAPSTEDPQALAAADGTVVVDAGLEGDLVTAGTELAVAYDLSSVRVPVTHSLDVSGLRTGYVRSTAARPAPTPAPSGPW